MKKILVIEDDKYLRDLIVEKLKKEQFEVLEAIDGEVGWKMTNNHHPDLVILDIVLPLLNGFDYLKIQSVLLPALHVLFLTQLLTIH